MNLFFGVQCRLLCIHSRAQTGALDPPGEGVVIPTDSSRGMWNRVFGDVLCVCGVLVEC